jgi:hypothetical protein
MKRKTVTDLEREVKNLEPYREAYFCLMKGLVPVQVRYADRFITVVGMDRVSGGVIIGINGEDCAVHWISDFISYCSQDGDWYMVEIARKLIAIQNKHVAKRYNQ